MLAEVAGAITRVGRARVAIVGARRAARLLRIGGACVAGPVARLGQVAFARRRTAHRPVGLYDIRWTVRPVARAVLGDVTPAGYGGAADHATGDKGVCGTGRARARAGLRHVAHARRGAAHRPRVPRRMCAVQTGSIAYVTCAHVAVVWARRPARLGGMGARGRADRAVADVARAHVAVVAAPRPRRLDRVGRTGGARPGAGLLIVALVQCGAAHRAGGQERVGGAGCARAGAGLGHVTGAG